LRVSSLAGVGSGLRALASETLTAPVICARLDESFKLLKLNTPVFVKTPEREVSIFYEEVQNAF
jgi:hypothetical protein